MISPYYFNDVLRRGNDDDHDDERGGDDSPASEPSSFVEAGEITLYALRLVGSSFVAEEMSSSAPSTTSGPTVQKNTLFQSLKSMVARGSSSLPSLPLRRLSDPQQSQGGGFHEYIISISLESEDKRGGSSPSRPEGSWSWYVKKRYSKLYDLRKAMLIEIEGTNWVTAKRAFTASVAVMNLRSDDDNKLVQVPELPPRKWFGSSTTETFVAQRSEGIAEFLWNLSQRPDLCCLQCVQSFLHSDVYEDFLDNDSIDVSLYTDDHLQPSPPPSPAQGATEKDDPWTSRLRIRSFGDVTRILFGERDQDGDEASSSSSSSSTEDAKRAIMLEKQLEQQEEAPSARAASPGAPSKPVPRLRFAIVLVGSRGDVQPYVALGKALIEKGHKVRIATHECFRSFVVKHGLEFFPLPGDPKELMEIIVQYGLFSPRLVTSGVATTQRKWVRKLLLAAWDAVTLSLDANGNIVRPSPEIKANSRDDKNDRTGTGVAYERLKGSYRADVIVANPPSFVGWHLAEALGCALYMSFPMPWTRTRSFPSPFTSVKQPFPWINYMSFGTVERLIWLGISDVINDWRVHTLKLKPIWTLSARGHRLLHDHSVPFIYPWSDKILPKPSDWGDHVCVPGYFFLEGAAEKSSAVPASVGRELRSFIENGSPPVYIGFGSIVVKRPSALRNIIMDAVVALVDATKDVRFLLQEGWGGMFSLGEGEEHAITSHPYNERVLITGPAPHTWLFGQCRALVHHGGAGTTAEGLKAGKPTLVVPFFGDQFFWGQTVVEGSGAGKCVAYKSLTAAKLVGAVKRLLEPETERRAMELGERIREQKGACEVAIEFIESKFPVHLLERADAESDDWWQTQPYMYEWEQHSKNAWRMPRAISSFNSLKAFGSGVGRLFSKLGRSASFKDVGIPARPSSTPLFSKASFGFETVDIPKPAALFQSVPMGHTRYSFWNRGGCAPPQGHTEYSWAKRQKNASVLL